MSVYTEPTMTELATREQQLRAEMIQKGLLPGSVGAGSMAPQAFRRPAPPTQTVVEQKPTMTDAALNPENSEILFINMVSGRVVTTLGEFNLDDSELSQFAFISLNCLRRNLTAVLESIEMKYRIPELQQAAQEAVRQQLQQQASQTTKSVKPQGQPMPAIQDEVVQAALDRLRQELAENAPTQANGAIDAEFTQVPNDEEIDEANDLPPIPLNRSRGRGRRSTGRKAT